MKLVQLRREIGRQFFRFAIETLRGLRGRRVQRRAGETIPAKELTYTRIYRRALKGPPELGYLTVRGYVAPKGMESE